MMDYEQKKQKKAQRFKELAEKHRRLADERLLEALEALDAEIKNIYHNATLGGDLQTESDFEADLFESEFEFWKEQAIEDLEEEFKDVIDSHGSIYQYGRGGRTLCFADIHNDHRYGKSFHAAADLLPNYSDEEVGEAVAWTEGLRGRLAEFNQRVREWCKTAPDECLKQIREEYAEEIKANAGKRRKVRQVVSYE